MENDTTNDLVNAIKTNYLSAKNGTVENPQAVAGAIRSALESAVKLFWQKRYDRIPVWVNGNREEFSLYEAISSVKFTKSFNTLEISDMNLIRKMCNDVLHGNVVFTVEIASELLARLEKCIKAIEREINFIIITEPPKPDTEPVKTNKKNETKENTKMEDYQRGKSIDLSYFWNTFEQILIENGEPFKIVHENGGKQTYYAPPNKYRAFTNNCVDISLVRRDGYLRVGLYVIDRNTRIGQVLLANKENIDRQLPFEHAWEDGTKNPDTLRVDTKFPIAGKKSREIIENALPYIMKYVEIAKIYGPNDFFDF